MSLVYSPDDSGKAAIITAIHNHALDACTIAPISSWFDCLVLDHDLAPTSVGLSVSRSANQ